MLDPKDQTPGGDPVPARASADGGVPPRRRAAAVVVWGVWGLAFLATLVFSRYYAIPFPYGDDWCGFVDVFTGKQPLSFD